MAGRAGRKRRRRRRGRTTCEQRKGGPAATRAASGGLYPRGGSVLGLLRGLFLPPSLFSRGRAQASFCCASRGPPAPRRAARRRVTRARARRPLRLPLLRCRVSRGLAAPRCWGVSCGHGVVINMSATEIHGNELDPVIQGKVSGFLALAAVTSPRVDLVVLLGRHHALTWNPVPEICARNQQRKTPPRPTPCPPVKRPTAAPCRSSRPKT